MPRRSSAAVLDQPRTDNKPSYADLSTARRELAEEAPQEIMHGRSLNDLLGVSAQQAQRALDEGKRIETKTMILVDMDQTSHYFEATAFRPAREAAKLIMWLVEDNEKAYAAWGGPDNPREGAEMFHTYSSVVIRQLAEVASELPVKVTFIRQPVVDGRTDPQTGRFAAWSVKIN